MAKIHLLPPEVISKIAAGEVIERPASVVKELLENSLDTGANSIELNLKQAGKTLIQIKDSGSGIEQEDLENVFLRHSTSKINNIADLYNISSLGFRGEALYSIAAVSDVTLRSKTKSGDSGWEIHVRENKKLNLLPVSLTNGTEIEVKELFFNTPARKKFLKSDTAETRQILNTFIPYTLLYPAIRFLLTHNGKTLIDLKPAENLIIRVAKSLNLKQENILEQTKAFPEDGISIRLLLGDINIQRTTKDMQFIFINNRPVQSRSLSFHLNQIYRLIFAPQVYPFFAVYLSLPPEIIDVNVHPTKREVKIKDESALLSLLRPFCENTLMSYGKAKQIKESIISMPEAIAQAGGLKQEAPALKPISNHDYPQKFFERTFDGPLNKEDILLEKTAALKEKLSRSQNIGAFHKKYLFFQTPDSLLIIDQHAAFERVTYEKLKSQIEKGRVEIQNLLTPILIRLTPQEMLAWEEIKDNLEKLGISTTLWGGESIAIHSHPILINNPDIALRNILSGENPSRYDLDTLARRACRQSVMVGDEIKKEGAEFLKNELLKCADPFTCPHGRPTVVEIREEALSKQFLR